MIAIDLDTNLSLHKHITNFRASAYLCQVALDMWGSKGCPCVLIMQEGIIITPNGTEAFQRT